MKLKLNKTLRAALIAAIATVGFTLSQAQADQQLNITPTAIPTSGGAGNSGFTWTDQGVGDSLTSWRLTFTLKETRNPMLDQPLLGTNGTTGTAGGDFLKVIADGSLTLVPTNNPASLTTASGVVTYNTPVVITLQYVANVDDQGVSLNSGTYSLSVGGGDFITLDVSNDPNTVFYGNSNSSKTRMWTNSKMELFSDISLYKLADKVVEIPTLTWHGTDGSVWSSSVWYDGEQEGQPYTPGAKTVFGAGEYATTVNITDAQQAGAVSVSGQNYAFNISGDGSLATDALTVNSSLSVTGTGTLAVTGSVSLGDGASLEVGENATLRLAYADAGELLKTVTGEGNVVLAANTQLAGVTDQSNPVKTLATGTLTIDHCQLKLGKMETGGSFSDYYVDLSSFKSITLDNGTLWVHTAPLTVKDVKVVNGTSTIHIQDKSGADKEYLTLAGTTTIDATSTLKFVGAWKGQTGIELLAGEGTLELAGPGETAKYHIDGGSIGKIIVSSGVVSATATNITTDALQMTAGTLAVDGTSSLGAINIGPGTLTINSGATVAAASLSIADNKKATLNINGSLDVSGKFYAIGCTNTTDIIGSGEGSSLTVGSLDICNVGTNFNLRNITMTVKGLANAGDFHNSNTTHIDLNAGSALNLLGAVTFKTSDSKYCTLNVNGGALTAGADEEGVVTRVFQNIAAGTSGGTVDFLNGSNTVANLDMTAGNLAVTVGEHASLTLAAGTLMSAIANEGVLTINGAIGLDNIGEEWVTTNPYGYEGSDDTENNGFVASALTKVTFATGDGSVVLGEGVEAAMTYKGYHGTVTEGVFNVLQDAPDHSTYHLNSATEESLATAISVGGTDLNLVIMNAGTNLSATGVDATVDTLRINTTGGDAATLTAGTASFTHLIGEGEVDVAAETTLTAANITVAQGKELTIGGEGALHGVTAINGAGTTHVDAAGVAGGALAISGGGTTTFGGPEHLRRRHHRDIQQPGDRYG